MTKIEMNRAYRTRDGRKVRIYAVDGKGPSSVVHGAVNAGDGWVPLSWHADGRYNTQTGMADLIEVKPRIKREVWVNVYEDYQFLTCHHDKGAANWNAKPNRIACVMLTIDCEEGEGL